MGPKFSSEFGIGRALLFKFKEVDIVSNSWAMRDNGKNIWYSGLISLSALKAGITKVIIPNGKDFSFDCKLSFSSLGGGIAY